MKKIRIPTPKGKIDAIVNYPENKTNKLAILCPGYLDTKDYNHLKNLAGDLAENGYTVIRFDPIGTWESEGDISDYTTTQYLEDVKNVLEYMLKQNNFKNILIGGHSRGGKISILYAARDPRISRVIGIMPSSIMIKNDERAIRAKTLGYSISFRDIPKNNNQKREFRVPYSHFQDGYKYNVLKDVKKIKAPLFLIAGEIDKLVLPKNVKEIYDKTNEPKKFVLIPGIGHNYRKNPAGIKLVNREIINFLKVYED